MFFNIFRIVNTPIDHTTIYKISGGLFASVRAIGASKGRAQFFVWRRKALRMGIRRPQLPNKFSTIVFPLESPRRFSESDGHDPARRFNELVPGSASVFALF